MRPSCKSALVGVAALTMLMAATPAMAADRVGVVREAGGATAVADSYLVVFKETAVTGPGSQTPPGG
nr:hypothetical protein [Micromonospora provocatoris]